MDSTYEPLHRKTSPPPSHIHFKVKTTATKLTNRISIIPLPQRKQRYATKYAPHAVRVAIGWVNIPLATFPLFSPKETPAIPQPPVFTSMGKYELSSALRGFDIALVCRCIKILQSAVKTVNDSMAARILKGYDGLG